jgi:predicted transcriptional regulator
MTTRSLTLGELETAVMEHLWEVREADVKAVWRVVGKRRKVTHNTVQSTMDRLFKKGLLDRDKVSHAFVYTPRLSRAQYRASVIRGAAESVSRGETEMLAAFVDVVSEAGADSLAQLEALIAEKRREEEES